MKILIYGATSDMARELAKIYAKEFHSLILVGRNTDQLNLLKKELENYGSKCVSTYLQDFRNLITLTELNIKILSEHKDVSLTVIAHGLLLPTLEESNFSVAALEESVTVNYTSHISIINFWANQFSKINSGKVVVFSSISGDRGRRSNYFYGSLKAGLNVYLEGFSASMAEKGVSLILIKPGLIDTKMTRHIKKNFLFINAEKAASIIFSGINRNKRVVYIPGFWKWIMCILKLIPYFIFKKLKF